MKKVFGFLIVFLFLGCSHRPFTVMAPDGKPAIAVGCKAYKVDCYRKAEKACRGKPYKIVDDSTSSTSFGTVGAGGGMLAGVSSANGTHSLLIRCEEPKTENIAESKK